jgi:hypothetical protein
MRVANEGVDVDDDDGHGVVMVCSQTSVENQKSTDLEEKSSVLPRMIDESVI